MCLKKQEFIRHQHDQSPPYVYFSRSLSQCQNRSSSECKDADYRPDIAIEQQLDKLWSRETWFPYLAGNEEQRNRAFGQKKTYLVVWNNPKGGGTWFLLDTYSNARIKRKYPKYFPFDDKPKWMSDSQKQRFVKNCDGTDLHWDIEQEPTGWLYDYSRGVIKDIICK